MRPITYSWIGLSAASPLIFLMCAWVLGVFHSYRRYWRSVDLFLLAMFVQELVMAIQVFTFALLSLMKPESGIACSVFVWSLSATRTLQAATATSLLVDRALTSQWPYKYRFSVRRHQIRYHLVVLATMAALVGVAAILARPSDSPQSFGECTFLPHNLHVRLSLFLLSLYGIFLVISAVSIAVVQTTRGCRTGSAGEPLDLAPIALGTTGSSTTTSSGGRTQGGRPLHLGASSVSTASSTSSGRMGDGMHLASSTTDLVSQPFKQLHHRNMKMHHARHHSLRTPATDFRWKASLAVTGLCFSVNHLPYMCLLVIGTFFPGVMPPWPMENLALWLSLCEGLLMPIVLGLSDSTFSESAVSSVNIRDTGSSKAKESSGVGAPFRLFPKEEMPKAFPLTNGSLFSSILTMNVDAPMQVLVPSYRRDKHKGNCKGAKMGISAHEIRGLVGAMPPTRSPHHIKDTFGHLFFQSEQPHSIGSLTTSSNDPIYSDPLNKACSSMDSSLKLHDDDHIYATLSETFGSLSSLSDGNLGEHHRCSSATTVANDDFEYHGPRGHHNHLRGAQHISYEPSSFTSSSPAEGGFVSACNITLAGRPPAHLPTEVHKNLNLSYDHESSLNSSTDSSPASSFRSSSSDGTFESNETQQVSDIPPILRVSRDLAHSGCYSNEAFVSDTLENKRTIRIESNSQLKPNQHELKEDSTLTRKSRGSSLSMNDLDRLEQNEQSEDEEMMFILPVKSESMLSLYRLYLAEDDDSNGASLHYSVDLSQSENDLTAISHPKKTSVAPRTKQESPIHEIYQKKRPVASSGSKIRRQNKIQRAKGVQRTRPLVTKRGPKELRNTKNNWRADEGLARSVKNDIKVAVMNRAKTRNGIITIRDPSVLSVEELFKVLNRASCERKEACKDRELKHPTKISNHCIKNNMQNTTEYKKIFVSEYL